jgi:hypothetical protein
MEVEAVLLYYSGDKVSKEVFYGNRTEYNFGADALGHVGLTGTYARLSKGNTVIGRGVSVGFGLSAFVLSGNINKGRTQEDGKNVIVNWLKD